MRQLSPILILLLIVILLSLLVTTAWAELRPGIKDGVTADFFIYLPDIQKDMGSATSSALLAEPVTQAEAGSVFGLLVLGLVAGLVFVGGAGWRWESDETGGDA